jgi:hypothetical protein
MTRGLRRSPLRHRRGRVVRSLVAGLFLPLELPVLPLIAGAAVASLLVQVGSLPEHLSSRGRRSVPSHSQQHQ